MYIINTKKYALSLNIYTCFWFYGTCLVSKFFISARTLTAYILANASYSLSNVARGGAESSFLP